ncbi:MAG TPA: acyl-CoA dehydrogenase family protein [Nocardioides sp.]|nr:acyl-CoA dehydrogenase family protein [Nocardioides sp.]
MRRTLFTEDHESFRKVVAQFMADHAVPHFQQWEEQGYVDRSFFKGMAELGVMGMAIPEEFGGSGVDDYRYNLIVQEEASKALVALGPLRLQLDVILPYFLEYTNEEQKKRWLPGLASGDLLTAIAMSEPGTGSDLAGVRTNAVRDGDHYVLNGAKTFITGGWMADLTIVICRTSVDPDNRRNGLTLLVVEDGMPGYEKGKKLQKIGLKSQDTVELSFTDVRVPVENVLGEEGKAFGYLGHNLAQERLTIAVGSVASARAALQITLDYVKERELFGQHLADFQNTKFELAAVATEVEAAQTLLDRAIEDHVDKVLDPAGAAMTKLFTTEVQARVVDRCLQLFGGYGYVYEYPIARLYADARVARIYGGTSEVMKTIISKSLGL